MSTPLDDIQSYSACVYALGERHDSVVGSTLVLTSLGATLGKKTLGTDDLPTLLVAWRYGTLPPRTEPGRCWTRCGW